MIAALVCALVLSVSPAIQFAPATLHARVRLAAEDVGDTLVVVLRSADYAQRSEYPFVANGRPQTVWLPEWKRVPSGAYEVIATLTDHGRMVSSTRQTVQIQPGLGGN